MSWRSLLVRRDGHSIWTLATLLALTLSACSGESGSPGNFSSGQATSVVSLQDDDDQDDDDHDDDSSSNKHKKRKKDKSIAGSDANSNGVRDDVENYIAKTYADPAKKDTKAALMQYAKGLQAVVVDASTPSTATAAIAGQHVQELANAFQCLGARNPTDFAVLTSKLRLVALNTDARRQAYLKAEQLAEAAVNQLQFRDPADWGGACL
jgi:hypothetical protein